MRTITFVYDTDTEDEDEAIAEARHAIADRHFDPFSIEIVVDTENVHQTIAAKIVQATPRPEFTEFDPEREGQDRYLRDLEAFDADQP